MFLLHSNGKPRKQCKRCLYSRRKPISVEARNEMAKKYRERNRQKCLQASRTWRKKNLEYDAFRSATYRATKINQTPKWANLAKIKEVYLNCPDGFHVDHIVPLRGKNVCGLHVENNLQYLTAQENLKKRNFYEL